MRRPVLERIFVLMIVTSVAGLAGGCAERLDDPQYRVAEQELLTGCFVPPSMTSDEGAARLETQLAAIVAMSARIDSVDPAATILPSAIIRLRGAGFHQLNYDRGEEGVQVRLRLPDGSDVPAVYWANDINDYDTLMHVGVPDGITTGEGEIYMTYNVTLNRQNCPALSLLKETERRVVWNGPSLTVEFGSGVAPNGITDLRARALSDTEIALHWTPINDAKEHRILMREVGNGSFRQIGTVSGKDASSLVSRLQRLATYDLQVRSCNSWGCADSAIVRASTLDRSMMQPGNAEPDVMVTILDSATGDRAFPAPLTRDGRASIEASATVALFDGQRNGVVDDGTQNQRMPGDYPLFFNANGAIPGHSFAVNNGDRANVVVAASFSPTSGASRGVQTQYIAVHMRLVQTAPGVCDVLPIAASGGDNSAGGRIAVAGPMRVTLSRCVLPNGRQAGSISGFARLGITLQEFNPHPAPAGSTNVASSEVRIDFNDLVLISDDTI